MTALPSADFTACNREPIHIPGAIQPHGLLLVASAQTFIVIGGAGALETRLAPKWMGVDLDRLLGQDVVSQVANLPPSVSSVALKDPVSGRVEGFDGIVHCAGAQLLVELERIAEQPTRAMARLWSLDRIARGFEEAVDLVELCRRTAEAVRALTGFERVMVYRFLDDESGQVIAEDRDPASKGFLQHHFPAADIPSQARALYVRNRARAIPDVDYEPAPVRPSELAGVDLSDVGLRSVSPVHLQYLRNMGVRASASFSIVRGSALWGLIACHGSDPHFVPRETIVAATALANALGRQVAAREEHKVYASRLRLRGAVDELRSEFVDDRALIDIVGGVGDRLRRVLDADGFAYVEANSVQLHGIGPRPEDMQALATWAEQKARRGPFASRRLAEVYPAAAGWPERASGLLAIPLAEEGRALLWLRVEQVEEIRWAGDPSKLHAASPDLPLTPRRSFDTWMESVHGVARAWNSEMIGAARRMARCIDEARFHRRVRLLNRELQATVEERDVLLAQQELLMREVDHRVQNSLQMVSSYLTFQAREAGPGEVADRLAEAQARLSAVGLVHRRLYLTDHPEAIDLGEYLGDLIHDLGTALGSEWGTMLETQLAVIPIATKRAVPVGLVMTELVINSCKYAYGGAPGPIRLSLERLGERFRFTLADRGRGMMAGESIKGSGFGSRVIAGAAQQLGATLDTRDNHPGLRVSLTAQIDG